jgi:Zn finger protein HypA/HybF involved in hydrogenase expression
MTKRFVPGETVVIQCESCEPELATVVCEAPPCPDCSGQVFRLETEAKVVVNCCASIVFPIH